MTGEIPINLDDNPQYERIPSQNPKEKLDHPTIDTHLDTELDKFPDKICSDESIIQRKFTYQYLIMIWNQAYRYMNKPFSNLWICPFLVEGFVGEMRIICLQLTIINLIFPYTSVSSNIIYLVVHNNFHFCFS